jgi:hypothetical protein
MTKEVREVDLVLTVLAFVAFILVFDYAAARWGYDSRDNFKPDHYNFSNLTR